MKVTSFKKLAVLGGLVLNVTLATAANALVLNAPTSLPTSATVQNSITVVITTPISFGTLGAIRNTVDTASLSISAAGVATEDPGTGVNGGDPAALVFDPSDPPIVGEIDVSGTFPSTPLYVTYQNCINPSFGGDIFILSAIVDNLLSPSSFDCVAGLVVGNETTDPAGALNFNVGATITTTTISNAAYIDGVYNGSVEVVFSY